MNTKNKTTPKRVDRLISEEFWICRCENQTTKLHSVHTPSCSICGAQEKFAPRAALTDVVGYGEKTTKQSEVVMLLSRQCDILNDLQKGVTPQEAQSLLEELAEIETAVQKAMI